MKSSYVPYSKRGRSNSLKKALFYAAGYVALDILQAFVIGGFAPVQWRYILKKSLSTFIWRL